MTTATSDQTRWIFSSTYSLGEKGVLDANNVLSLFGRRNDSSGTLWESDPERD